jgi:hypothetical protein
MIKPASLRAAIEAMLPELQRDPDRLLMWVDQGSIVCRSTPTASFAYRYRLNVILIDFAGEPSVLMLAVTEWLRTHQPERLTPGNEACTIEVDLIDSKLVDLQLQLQLDEMVSVNRLENGSHEIRHLPEPSPLFDDDLPLIASDGNAAPGTPPLTEIADESGDLPPWN